MVPQLTLCPSMDMTTTTVPHDTPGNLLHNTCNFWTILTGRYTSVVEPTLQALIPYMPGLGTAVGNAHSALWIAPLAYQPYHISSGSYQLTARGVGLAVLARIHFIPSRHMRRQHVLVTSSSLTCAASSLQVLPIISKYHVCFPLFPIKDIHGIYFLVKFHALFNLPPCFLN